MYFADIHIHALFGTDDGPREQAEMYAMLDEAYRQGVRAICFTPHWNPIAYGNNADKAQAAFAIAREYLIKTEQMMTLFLANELRYSRDADKYLRNGSCKKYDGSRYVLVDFNFNERADNIADAIRTILSIGMVPVLAHVERYPNFGSHLKTIEKMKADGIRIQLDAGSILGEFGFCCRKRAMKLLSEGLADIIVSDAHGIKNRPIALNRASALVVDKFGNDYAERLFWDNPREVLTTVRSMG